MPHVIYNGNGADGGQVPVDSNTYATDNPVNDGVNDATKSPYEQTDSNGNPLGIVTGNLTKTGATFLYWNTAADGSGIFHGWPADTSFAFPGQSVAPGAIIENKRLGAALAFARERQASYPPNRRRGDPRRQRPPNNLEAPGMPTKGRPSRKVLAAAAAE
jgi:hypothetical protein